jgi:hypothetical protein
LKLFREYGGVNVQVRSGATHYGKLLFRPVVENWSKVENSVRVRVRFLVFAVFKRPSWQMSINDTSML